MTATGVDSEPIFHPKEAWPNTCYIPLCTTYLRGKGGITLLNSKVSLPDPEHLDVLKEEDLMPGDNVNTDQYECRVKGRLPSTRGTKVPHSMLCAYNLFMIILHQR